MSFKNDNDPFKHWKIGAAVEKPLSHAGITGIPINPLTASLGELGPHGQVQIQDMNPSGSIAAGIDALVERVAQRAADIVCDRLQHMLNPEILRQPPESPEQQRARAIAEWRATADAQHRLVLEALNAQTTLGPIRASVAFGGSAVVVTFEEPSLQTKHGRCAYVYAAESCNSDGRRYVEAMPGEFGFEYQHGEPLDEYNRGGNRRLMGVKTLDEVVMAARFLATHREPCECMYSSAPTESCERMRLFEAGCWLRPTT